MCTGNRAYAGGGNNCIDYVPTHQKTQLRISSFTRGSNTSAHSSTAMELQQNMGDLAGWSGNTLFSLTYLTDDTTWTPIKTERPYHEPTQNKQHHKHREHR